MGNDRIDLFYMIGFASGANVSLVAKNGTKIIIPLLWIKSSKKPQIKKFHKTDPPKSGNSDSKYNVEIFKTKNQTQKRPPKFPKKKKKKKKNPPKFKKKKKKKKKKK